LAENQLDVAAGNSTDGRIELYKLKILADDKKYFPAYQAAPVARLDTLRKYPQVEKCLNKLGGQIDDAAMQALNYEVDGNHKSPAAVVATFLKLHPEITKID
jgi:glycine betaine/choline ABC-type transport system substrate-binding protein